MHNLDSVLEKNQSQWAEAETIPDGLYMAEIKELTFKEIGKDFDKKWKLIWSFRITGPSHSGRVVSIFNDLDGEYIRFTKENLSKVGCRLEKMADLKTIVYENMLLSERVMIELITKKDKNGVSRQNTYLKGRPQEPGDGFDHLESDFSKINNFEKSVHPDLDALEMPTGNEDF